MTPLLAQQSTVSEPVTAWILSLRSATQSESDEQTQALSGSRLADANPWAWADVDVDP